MTEYPRVAVLMMGNMRSYNVTAKNLLLFLLEPYNCDLYLTTYTKRFNFKGDAVLREEIVNENQIRGAYGPRLKHLVIVNQDSFTSKYESISGKHYAFGDGLSRFYTIQKLAFLAYEVFRGECVRNKRTYDMIIKIRPDIMLKEKFPLNMNITSNQLIVPTNDSGGGFNDQIAYGKHRVMEKYLGYYKNFGDIDRLDNGRACDVSIVESGLRKNMETLGIEIIRINIHYIILRDIKPQKVVYFGKNQFYVKKF